MVKYELLEYAKDVLSILDFQISALCAVGITDGFFLLPKITILYEKEADGSNFYDFRKWLKMAILQGFNADFQGVKRKTMGYI